MFLFRVAKLTIGPFMDVFYPCKKLGYKEQPFDGSTMIVSNHNSNADAIVIGRCFRGQTYYLCKKELFKKKSGAFFIKHLGGVKIDREKPEIGEIKNCLQVLKKEKRLVVFPEGTRNKSGNNELLPIKGGAGMFAFKAKARIIPMYIMGTPKFLRKQYVFIGEPFDLSEFYGQKFNQELSDKIAEIITEKILFCRDNIFKYIDEKKNKKKKNK